MLSLFVPIPLLTAAAVSFFNKRSQFSWILVEFLSFSAFFSAFFVHIDIVRLVMTLLVTFIGWIVVRYARTYLDGEERQSVFMGWLCLTLAAVVVLVMSGQLALLFVSWVATGFCLQKLLLFYPQRTAAQWAVRKKALVARVGDLALALAVVILAGVYKTGDIDLILQAARAGQGGIGAGFAAGFLALAAALKSAQFPTHGWLTEVMETPTPVSALLHAGLINAGGFLLIRFADVMLLAPGVLAALGMIGGFTALFGSLVMLTQPYVKTSLAWSTVAQMGFMIFECGLALFPLALLHIVAHSLYKAHSFLTSGGAVERVAAIKRPGLVAIPSATAVAKAFGLGLLIYLFVGLGFVHKTPQAQALGLILIFGVAYVLAQGLADAAPRALTWRTALYALGTSVGYFTLQALAIQVTAHVLPSTPQPGVLQWALIGLALVSFGLVAIVQAMFPLWAYHPAAAGLRVHFSNGFYINAIGNRLLGVWRLS